MSGTQPDVERGADPSIGGRNDVGRVVIAEDSRDPSPGPYREILLVGQHPLLDASAIGYLGVHVVALHEFERARVGQEMAGTVNHRSDGFRGNGVVGHLESPNGPLNLAEHVCIQQERVERARGRFGDSWELEASSSSLTGLSIKEILDHYTRAELLADWEKARAKKGDSATAADLSRTAAQRASDAVWQIFQDAAAKPESAVPVGFVHNIVWQAEILEELIRRFAGAPAQAIDVESFRCSNIDGVPASPSEALAGVFVDGLRHVVMNARSTVIDQGCWVTASQCQIDHVHPHASGGRTNPGNGAPRCGRHNRFKEKGFTVWRDPAGQWHTYRPDGTEIE